MRGNWVNVWDSFARRKQAKVTNDAPEAVVADADMFAQAGVAAE